MSEQVVKGLAERVSERTLRTPTCWLWQGYTTGGYGRISINGRTRLAHRVAYELAHGVIGGDVTIDHLCRVRSCVNPDHLEAVTTRINVLRGIGPTAINARRDRCIHGHEFTPENTRITKKGRDCRACARERHARQQSRRRTCPTCGRTTLAKHMARHIQGNHAMTEGALEAAPDQALAVVREALGVGDGSGDEGGGK